MDNIEKNFFESYDSFDISLGELLRGERATLGKSYSDVQKDLKIKSNYIKAIEKCDLCGLENKSFIAGYVRTYARYLGLDPEYVYERFCSESGYAASNLNSFELKKTRIESKKQPKLSSNNFWKPGKFSQNHFALNYSKLILLKKAIPIFCLCFIFIGVGYWIKLILLDLQKLEFIPIDQEPYSSVELSNRNNDLLNITDINNTGTDDSTLENIYLDEEKIFPVIQNRNSPISKIDPNTYGLFLKTEKMININDLKKNLKSLSPEYFTINDEPKVVLRPKIASLKLLALEKSWIRLKDQKGDIYLERNLKKDEEFVIPKELFSGSLRAGNSTKVFFELNGKLFGPLSSKKSVIKNFSLNPQNIKSTLTFVSENIDVYEAETLNKSKALNTANKID